MSDRWSILGGDPAPGDPGWIDAQAATFRNIAQDAGSCREQLAAIAEQWRTADWQGRAAEMFRSRLGTLVPDLSKASVSYGSAGAALASFGATLAGLQEAASGALQRAVAAQSEIDEAHDAANEAADRLRALERSADDVTQELSTVTDQVEAIERQLAAGTGNAASATELAALRRRWDQLRSTLDALDAQIADAQRAVADAASQEADGRRALAAAEQDADGVRSDFNRAVDRTEAALHEAAARGVRNLDFFQQTWRDMERTELHLATEVHRQFEGDLHRFERDSALVATGHLSGLRNLAEWAGHDIVAAAPEVHAVVHALDTLVRQAASLMREVAPILEVACIVAAVVQPELIPFAASAFVTIRESSEGLDVAAVGLDDAEVASDALMEADGRGNQVNVVQDEQTLESDTISAAVEVVGDGIGGALDLPSLTDVFRDALSSDFSGAETDLVGSEAVGTSWTAVERISDRAVGLPA